MFNLHIRTVDHEEIQRNEYQQEGVNRSLIQEIRWVPIIVFILIVMSIRSIVATVECTRQIKLKHTSILDRNKCSTISTYYGLDRTLCMCCQYADCAS